MTSSTRLTTHADTAAALALLSDGDLADLVASGTPSATGVGGRCVLVEVDGTRVFVKQVPLTDRELLPHHVRSTANLFGVPPFCHYGIGAVCGPGFGAWRELAVHEMTTDWVLSGRCSGFPLMRHWRVLPHPPRPLPDELADVDAAIAYWGAREVGDHIEALRTASASLTLFLEYVPHTLHDWLHARLRTAGAETACALVEEQLVEITEFLHGQGLVHFDAHFRNVLTDGRRLHLADYGLAVSDRFRLTAEERAFLDRHRGYDQAYVRSYLVHWLVVDLYGYARDEHEAFIRDCADGRRPEGIPRGAAALISRHARIAATLGDFHRRIERHSRLTPYPYEELAGLSADPLSAGSRTMSSARASTDGSSGK
ncbi:protein kinase family protein [Streptomyces sp. YU58]|uniref:protein kinase family protein n=1 Tax=Streptomyces sp. SX92 TaxID=3158972 RepID=UPI0027BA33ED|nr:protein kinase family protein [Streptomyces coralus]WLW57163.1 protein kinase family protein [Streptomyces coralus]